MGATTAKMIRLCSGYMLAPYLWVMAQRTKKLARNHKSAFPEKFIVPALPQHIVRCQLYPPSDLRPFQTRAAFLFSNAVCRRWRTPIRFQRWPLKTLAVGK